MPNRPPSRPTKVALLIETSRGYGRQLLEGIIAYSRQYGPWSFYLTPGDFEQHLPNMKDWAGHGIIARIENARIAKALRDTRLPVIALDLADDTPSSSANHKRFSQISPDPRAAMVMGIEHFLERGFKQFAFCGFAGRVWSDQRQHHFVQELERRGLPYHLYRAPRHRAQQTWEREQPRLARFLTTLPTHTAVMTCNDDRGRQLLDTATTMGLNVPGDLAVLGMDNDTLLCNLCDPPLSSIALQGKQAGFEAAHLLDRLMRHKQKQAQHILVNPTHIVERQSTDMLAMEDRQIAQALLFIRQNPHRMIGVEDVLRQVPLSRRSLEMRFQRTVGWTVNQEIQRVHLERAKQLLLETDLSLEQIAEISGFNSTSYFCSRFKHQTGQTARQYRVMEVANR